jgi:uncharacterized protein (DUF736 family)
MAITLGTFTKLDDGSYTGVLKTLHVTTGLVILPVDKIAYSDDVGRAFRLMSATCSDRSRPAVPIDVGRGGGAPAGRM